MNYILNIGDLVTGKTKDVTYSCLGLGTCLGVFLQDRSLGISGGAHIMLPDNESTVFSYFKYGSVSAALDEMMQQFKVLGSNLNTLRAKVAGGASIYTDSLSTGERNVASVTLYLKNHGIYIAAMDVGGTYNRAARFDCGTGTLHVNVPQTNEYRTY
jgi:chemotaxis protein CheD